MRSRTIVITGASAGVGRVTAREFAKEGAYILLIARGKDGLLGAKQEVESVGGKAWTYEADVSSMEEMEKAAAYAEENIGPIDVWVNNAMVSVFSPAQEMTAEEYKRVTEVTYLGQVYGTLVALKYMAPRNKGAVILVGSALAYRGIPLQSAYCASKHAIQGFFESLRAELLHDNSAIKLSIVHLPAMNTTQFGWVKTRFNRKPKPMGQIFQPEVAARAIVEVSHTGERERLVGFSTAKTILGNKVVPEYLDHFMAKNGYEGQLTNEPEEEDRQDNLWKPVPGDQGSYGGFKKQAQNYSLYDMAHKHRKTLGMLGVALLTAISVRSLVKR